MTDPLSRARDVETNMLAFADHWKYIPTLPRGPQGDKAILMLDYLIPDLAHIVAGHYISLGWRYHRELGIIKPRKIVGGALTDLVTYVPVQEPDEPIVVEAVPYDPDAPPPDLNQLPWRVKPEVHETFEERPDDE